MTVTPADFETLLRTLTTRTSIDDLKEILRDHVDHRGASTAAVAWLAGVIGTERFAEAAIEAGVLVRPTFHAFGREYLAGYTAADPTDPASVDRADMTLDPRAMPLYRIGGTDA